MNWVFYQKLYGPGQANEALHHKPPKIKKEKRHKHKKNAEWGWTKLPDGSWKCQGCNFIWKKPVVVR